MKLSDDQIKEAISNDKISAITLDTSVFDGNGNRFEHGLLARLQQFNNTAVHVVLSDVVVGEVKAHVTRAADEAYLRIRTGIKEVSKTWQVTQEQRDVAMTSLFGKESPEQLAQRRLTTFIEVASVELIESSGRVDVDEVLTAYFTARPPFGKSAAKKSEFPDAFALQALEKWARDENTLLLVVSKDGDWQRYCNSSEYLVPVEDLAKALSYFHQNAEVACARLVERFAEGSLTIEENIAGAIQDATDQLTFIPEANSIYRFDADVYAIDVLSVDIEPDPETDKPFKVIDKPDEDMLVVEASVKAVISVTTSFQFSLTDPIDKDEVPMGSASATAAIPIDVRTLLTFQGDLSGEAQLVDLEVEMSGRSVDLDYGEVGPDWEPDPDDYSDEEESRQWDIGLS